MAHRAIGVGVIGLLLFGMSCWISHLPAEESRFAMTHSRSQYVHWIEIYDAAGRRIDPTDPNAAPYSPVHTCGRCHEYEAIAHGHHFNAKDNLVEPGRPGEPWIWTDTRTGTQIPLSYRGWPGTYDPRELNISAWDFLLKFAHHMPGGGVGFPPEVTDQQEDGEEVSARDLEEQEADSVSGDFPTAIAEPQDNGRWSLSGELPIDCMMCHSHGGEYSAETWWDEISKQNFAWAPAAALGIADVDGDVSRVKDPEPPADNSTEADDAEGEQETPAEPELPKTTYRPGRMNAEKQIFFDVIRKPANDVCYYCHTTRVVGDDTAPDWTHDEDVHLAAGMTCVDCHRNGIEHHTVRGFEGEQHPTGYNVVTLSCRGCHLGDEEAHLAGGRLGAPKPLHKGLPPIHFELLSCTACHSGPRPAETVRQVQTALAHGLGLPTHHLTAATEPAMVAPVLLKAEETLFPHRMMWPAFWGLMRGEEISPLPPEEAQELLRRTLRVRRNATFTETLGKVTVKAEDKAGVLGEERAQVPVTELTEEEKAKLDELKLTLAQEAFREKLGEALKELSDATDEADAQPVYVAGGRAYRLGTGGAVEVFDHAVAKPYAWQMAHDVRPARWSTGASGCYECHALGTPIFDGEVTAMGPAIDSDPPTEKMAEMAGIDRLKIDLWNMSFQGRAAFKWFGFMAAGVVALILLSFVLLGLNGFFGLFRRS